MLTNCPLSAVRAIGGIQLAACLLLAAGCAAKSKWTAPWEDDRYLYVPGVATGADSLEEGKRRAVHQAVSEIVQFIGYTSTVEYNEKRTELSTKILDQFSAVSGETRVRGAMVEDLRYRQDPGKGTYDVQVIVRFPKEEIQRERVRLRKEEAERAFAIQESLRDAAAAEGRGDVRSALARYIQVLRLCASNSAFGNARAQAASALCNLAGRLRLEPVSGNSQMGELYGGLPDPLVVRATLHGSGRDVPAGGLPVTFEAADSVAEITQTGTTDEKGLAFARVGRIRSISSGNRVKASLDLDRLLPQPSDLSPEDSAAVTSAVAALRKQTVEFSFASYAKRSVRVLLQIEEKNLDVPVEPSILEHQLSSRLLEAGFQVAMKVETDPLGDMRVESEREIGAGRKRSSDAEFLVRGRASTRPTGPGFSGMTCCLCDVSVDVVSPADGNVIARRQELGIKGFGLSEKEAGLQALRKAAAAAADPIVDLMLEAVIRQETRRGTVP